MPARIPDSPEQQRLNAIALEIKRRGLTPKPAVLEAETAIEMAHRGIGAKVYKTFRDYVAYLKPDILQFEHVPKLIDVVDRLLAGALKHVMILAPPRYYKSDVFSRLLPGYYLHHNPAQAFALASHAANLAWQLSEAARDNYTRSGGILSQTAQARARWQTVHRDAKGRPGEMWAVGMGASAIGKGFNLGGVDDPIDPAHVFSYAWRQKFELWWENDWLRAREPGAKMFFVMQRLGMDDPVDYLFRQELTERALGWHVVVLDEVHSEEPLGRWSGPRGLPPKCTLEPDARKVGQILAPSLFSIDEVKERQRQSTPFVVAAQRQQRPMRASGDFWQKSWFDQRTYDELPETAYNAGDDWDTALTADERNSASARVRSYRGPAEKNQTDNFPVYIHDVDFRWLEFPELVKWMLSLPGPHYVEEKASGKSAVQQLKAYGITAKEIPVKGDKLARASSVQPHVSAGRVWVHSKVVEKLLWAEQQGLLRITAEQLQVGGAGLDLNDAFVQALHRHLGIHQERRPAVRFG